MPRVAHARPAVTSVKVKKVKGLKGGMKEQHDLIVNIDLTVWSLSNEVVADLKEVFMLFDKDEDGVLTFSELEVVMKCLGHRTSEKELLAMVREVSEDKMYDTIEFNEFLTMIGKQSQTPITKESLVEAFKIFDKDEKGVIPVEELVRLMSRLGEAMKKAELEEMVNEADSKKDGMVDYEEFCTHLVSKKDRGKKKQREP